MSFSFTIKSPGFFPLHAHDGVHLGQFFHVLTAGELFCQNIARLVKFRGLTALPGYDQRGSRLVDQHRVHLIDDGIVQFPKHKLLFINHHIIPQIIKAQFIVRHVSDIAVILLPALIGFHAVKHHSYFQSQEFMYLAHTIPHRRFAR